MKKRITTTLKTGLLLLTILIPSVIVEAQKQETTRDQWLYYLDKVARPVLSNIAADKLRENMEVALPPKSDNPESRKQVSYLEAFGRTLCGISPWLNSEGGSSKEIALRNQYREWALKGIANAVDPKRKDYLLWTGYQPLVDASFFALAFNRCPWLWKNLNEEVRKNMITALEASRSTVPVYSNWILFTGMIEAFFCKHNLPYDAVRIEYGVREFSQHWYVGDGMFSDGMHFALDYYNSYVIQPYLSNILETVGTNDKRYNSFLPKMEKIAARYAEIQERSINSDGSFPVFGRSIVYRGGAFHHLSDMALKHKLPSNLQPAQVRCALTAVIKKTLDPPSTFTKDGWLAIGLSGHQPNLADGYITTGSLYLCSLIFLPLGLPADDPFWINPDSQWTAQKIWSGSDEPGDHKLVVD
jgi:hypothetical protein